MKEPVNVRSQPEVENASLIVGWQKDAGRLGLQVISYLNRHINGKIFCEVEPENFFPMGGVVIENDVAQFPASRFYAGTRKDLVIFESNQPANERYKFLSSVLDVGQYYCKIDELYTVSGTVAPIAHTTPRRLLAAFNQAEFRERLRSYGLEDMTWEGPPDINSFLLCLAQKRGIAGVSLWSEVAFYLTASEDPKAVKSVLSFFDERFDLGLDFAELDTQIEAQSDELALLRRENQEIDEYIRTLEVGLSLSEEEQFKLAQGVTEFLEKARR